MPEINDIISADEREETDTVCGDELERTRRRLLCRRSHRFIPELEKCKTPVFLRPKRFGKSVICSMLGYFKSSELAAIGVEVKDDGTCDASKRVEPDAETLAQARRYRDSLPRRHGWDAEIVTKVIEVYCHYGYKWFAVDTVTRC